MLSPFLYFLQDDKICTHIFIKEVKIEKILISEFQTEIFSITKNISKIVTILINI